MGELTGRVALVTGAGRGIGASCAVLLAQQGATVVLAARTEAEVAKVAEHIAESGGTAIPVVVDLVEPVAMEHLFREVRERAGPLDILVCAAGLAKVGPFAEQTDDDLHDLVGVNVIATLRCARLALKDMLPRKRGVIIPIASVAGVAGIEKLPGLTAYAATKGAIVAFAEALGAEVRSQGIRVVSVSPAAVKTRMLQEAAPQAVDGAMHPGRVAEVVAWLASDKASGVTATNLVVWGPPATSAAPSPS